MYQTQIIVQHSNESIREFNKTSLAHLKEKNVNKTDAQNKVHGTKNC